MSARLVKFCAVNGQPIEQSCVAQGTPYEMYVRRNVILLHRAGWCAREIESFFRGRPCLSTIYRFVAAYEADVFKRVPEPLPHTNGNARTLSAMDAWVLWVAKNCMRTLSGRSCVQLLSIATGRNVSRSTVSRELVHRLGMSRMKMTNLSTRRDEAQRTNWFCNGPFHHEC